MSKAPPTDIFGGASPAPALSQSQQATAAKKKAPPTDFGGPPAGYSAVPTDLGSSSQSGYNAPYQQPQPTYNPPAPTPTYNPPAPTPVYDPPAPTPTYNSPQQYNTPTFQYTAPEPSYATPTYQTQSATPAPYAAPPVPQTYAAPQQYDIPQQTTYPQHIQSPGGTLGSSSSTLSVTTAVAGSSSGSGVRKRPPPTDFHELPLPDGYYRTSYGVVLPPAHRGPPGDSRYELRYTAATSNWDEFADPNPTGRKPYSLLPKERGQETKIMIVVTMYNEDAELFVQTMEGVYKNIEFLVDRKGEAEVDWNNIVVCIICDGRKKCPKDVKMALELLGCYQADELIMTDFSETPVEAHIFEHTSRSHVAFSDKKRKEIRLEPSRIDTQYILCMKEQNRRKIDSHGWAFRAFAPILKPDVIVLFDMGTKPEKEALYHLWMHFHTEERLGGACGEIKVRVEAPNAMGKALKLLTDPLLASQNFEYKMSNILDKSLQSVFGYITVLPGAFSAYRYQAIEGKPLVEYFRREFPPAEDDDVEVSTCTAITTANKYLAEDRILCFEVFTKDLDGWLLRYVKEAKANTDAPDKLGVFLNQRRRWFNGSMFAFLSAFFSMNAISGSSHDGKRKALFIFEMFYLMIDLIFSLLGPMNFFGTFTLMLDGVLTKVATPKASGTEIVEPAPWGRAVLFAVIFLYVLVFIFGMLLFVGNNPRGSSWVYKTLATWWGIIVITIMGLVVANGVNTIQAAQQDPTLKSVWEAMVYVIALVVTYGLYIGSSLIFRDVAHIFTSMPGYLLLMPTYVNVMLPFALSNIHDVSWGNRPEDPQHRNLPKNKMQDGKAVVTGVLTQDQHKLVVDVDELEAKLNKKPGKDSKEPGDRSARRRERKRKRDMTIEDRNKNVRMVLLFLFVVCNMGGGAMIAYFGVATRDLAAKEAFKNTYTAIIFGSIAAFALVRFVGVILFVSKTPRFKGDITFKKNA
ncbi:chitin synthase-domain-containing protein [Cladochytrium replicatum]|nr:chitin synthase-domain-containing protein [Cladochytrium replicatum]